MRTVISNVKPFLFLIYTLSFCFSVQADSNFDLAFQIEGKPAEVQKCLAAADKGQLISTWQRDKGKYYNKNNYFYVKTHYLYRGKMYLLSHNHHSGQHLLFCSVYEPK